MFLIKIIRFLFGYVIFSAYGGFTERFLNLAAKNNVAIWDTFSNKGVLWGKTTAKCYKKMPPIARKSGMRVRVREKIGLPFFLHRYRKRLGAFIGVILFFAILVVMSMFVWSIKVEGNKNVSSEEILSQLEEIGLKKGQFIFKINVDDMNQKARIKLDKMSWVAINIKGTKIVVDVRERVLPDEMIDTKTPCNVVAKIDGVITRIEAYEGMTEVKVGEVVLEGNMLISGTHQNKVGETEFIHARGKVMAKTRRVFKTETPMTLLETEQTGESVSVRDLNIFSLRIPLSFKKKPEEEVEEKKITKQLNIFGNDLPIYYEESLYQIVKKTPRKLSEDEAKLICMDKLKKIEENDLKDATILEKNQNVNIENDSMVMQTEYICEEDIAKEIEIQLEG